MRLKPGPASPIVLFLRMREGAAIRALHLSTLTSFAVAQPVYALLDRQPEFLVFQNAGRAEILGLVLVLSVVLPLTLVVVERLAGLIGPRTGRRVQETFVASGVALTLLPALRTIEAVHGFTLV